MFAKYYQSEIQYLRELGAAFGQANPDVAGLLVERGGDPDVERLIEGFAFVAAQIRERVDDAVPEIAVSLAELLLPHYVRTIPACSILELSPIPGAVRGRQRIAAGAEVASSAIDGTSCRFRTTTDVDLLPLSLSETVLDRVGSTAPVMRASFRITGKAHGAVFVPEPLRLFLHGEPPIAATLFAWLARHVKDVTLEPAEGPPIQLGKSSLRFPGFGPEMPLLPWPRLAPQGYRLLQELFVLPQKLLFVDVTGLERAAGVESERFDLVVTFDRPPDLPARPGRDLLRLFCTPVINLWTATSEPLRQEVPGSEHFLRAADVTPQHMEIYSVDAVMGARPGRPERRQIPPFVDFTHAAGAGGDGRYYTLRRRRSVLDDAIDTHLSLLTPRDIAPPLGEETLSVDLTCTNRGLPARLRVGDINQPTPLSPTTARFRNISPVTRPVRPPLGDELHWRLLSHLALNQRSLADAGALRALLSLYNFIGQADEQAGQANRLRIDAIREVRSTPVRRIIQGSPVRGVRFAVELDENGFASRGDAFLFGGMLDELLAQHVTINSFTELVILLQPSQGEYTWTARSGRRPIV